MNVLELISRKVPLFQSDMENSSEELLEAIENASFLVVGGGGSIGSSVVKQLLNYRPNCVHVVDLSENALVELVRDVRSSKFVGAHDLKTFAIDCGSIEFDLLVRENGPYDYVFNLSALKHVRSEKDQFSLMRMVVVNILNTVKLAQLCKEMSVKKYFCVSTDKAANPVNMMGASKRIMELFLYKESNDLEVSMARFANVAFSDGSLLDGFEKRLKKQQPIAAPKHLKRYFVTSEEAGQLCLLSGVLGYSKEIFYPILNENLHQITFPEIAEAYLNHMGYEPELCASEELARGLSLDLISNGKWPCFFADSDTTGEKEFEEFFTMEEERDLTRFKDIGIVKSSLYVQDTVLENFLKDIKFMRETAFWEKKSIVDLFHRTLPEFNHNETGKFLDEKM